LQKLHQPKHSNGKRSAHGETTITATNYDSHTADHDGHKLWRPKQWRPQKMSMTATRRHARPWRANHDGYDSRNKLY